MSFHSDVDKSGTDYVIDYHADGDQGEVTHLFDYADNADSAVELTCHLSRSHAREVVHDHDRDKHGQRYEQNVEVCRESSKSSREHCVEKCCVFHFENSFLNYFVKL